MGQGASRGTQGIGPPAAEVFGPQGGEWPHSLLLPRPPKSRPVSSIPLAPTLQPNPSFADAANDRSVGHKMSDSVLDTYFTESDPDTSSTRMARGHHNPKRPTLPMTTYMKPRKQRSAWMSAAAAALALALASQTAHAMDLSGVITVNGQETEGVIIAVYDCATSVLLASTTTGPTEIIGGIASNYRAQVASEDVRVELFFKDDPTDVLLTDYCRAFIFCGEIVPVNGVGVGNADMTCAAPPPPTTGTSTASYWQSHPAEWPVDSIDAGGVTYTKEQAIARMDLPVRKDKTKSVFPELVAAKLNILMGNTGDCINASIAAADAWLVLHPLGSGVKANTSTWKQISGAYGKLESYNAGLLCAPPKPLL